MFIVRVTTHNQRHAFNNIDSRFGQNFHFFRVIGQQTNFVHAQQLEHIRTQREITLICRKAQLMVSFNGIITLVLQRVGADFIEQADIASFLTMIKQDTAPFFSNMGESRFELEAAIATQAKQCIASQTFGVDTRQDRRLTCDIAKNQCDMIVSGCQFFKSHHQEITPGGWQFGFCHTFKLHVILQIMLALSCRRLLASVLYCTILP